MQSITLTVGGNTKRSKFTPKAVTLDVPEASADFLLRYGLKQYLADGVAGAETQDDFDEGIQARVDKVLTSDFARAKGEGKGTDTIETRMRKIVRQKVLAVAKARNMKLDAEQVATAVKTFLEKNAPSIRAQAEMQLAAEAKAAEGIDSDDVFAALGIEVG